MSGRRLGVLGAASAGVSAVALVIAALAAGMTTGGCGLMTERSPGEKLWRQHCAECHGLNGSGNTVRYMGKPYADLLDDTWKMGGDELALEHSIRDGFFGEMPSFNHLSSQEVRQLVQYVRVLRGEALPEGAGDGG